MGSKHDESMATGGMPSVGNEVFGHCEEVAQVAQVHEGTHITNISSLLGKYIGHGTSPIAWTMREGGSECGPADPQAHSELAHKTARRARHVIAIHIVPDAVVL
jgi:hypothetical protein